MVKHIKDMMQMRVSTENRIKLAISRKLFQKEVADDLNQKWEQDDALTAIINFYDSSRTNVVKIVDIYNIVDDKIKVAASNGIKLKTADVIEDVIAGFESDAIKEVSSEDGAIITSAPKEDVSDVKCDADTVLSDDTPNDDIIEVKDNSEELDSLETSGEEEIVETIKED